jgi:hypothetical protein
MMAATGEPAAGKGRHRDKAAEPRWRAAKAHGWNLTVLRLFVIGRISLCGWPI